MLLSLLLVQQLVNQRMIKPLIACFVFLLHVNLIYAQKVNLGSWNIVGMQYNYNSELTFFGEAQLRSLKFYNDFHYYEYKAGVMYKAAKDFRIGIAAGSYQTYKEGGDFVLPKNSDEFRLWPQAVLTQNIGPIKVEQRYRAEMRFTQNGYKNRFRYRLGLNYTFGKTVDNVKPFFVGLSNELFFTNNEPYFERNRLLVSFGYKPTKSSTIHVGYLHQFAYKITDETGMDFFQIGYLFELGSR